MAISENLLRELVTNQADFTRQLQTIIKLYTDLNSHRNERLNITTAFIQKFVQSLDANKLTEFVETHKDILNESNMYSLEFGHLMLSSFFSTSFSLFEIYLKETVNIADKINSSNLLNEDLHGSILEKLLKHLYSKHSIASANHANSQFKEIKAYRSIRNAIVHNGGKLSRRDTQNYLPTIQQFNVVLDTTNNFIRIEEHAFLTDFHNLIRAYGIHLNKEIIQNYN